MKESNKMKEYYLLPCKCLMTCEKIGGDKYRWNIVLKRCTIVGDTYPFVADRKEDYGGKFLSKTEATIEILKG